MSLRSSPFAAPGRNPRPVTRAILSTLGAVGAAVMVASFVGGEWQGRLIALGTGVCTALVSWRAVRRMWGRKATDIVGLGALYGIANASLMALACALVSGFLRPESVCVVLIGGQVMAMFAGCFVGFLYGGAYAALLRSRMGRASRARDGRLTRPFGLGLWCGFLSLVVGSLSVLAEQRLASWDLSQMNHWIGLAFALGLAALSEAAVLRAVLAHVRAYRWLRHVERGASATWGIASADPRSKLPLLFAGDANRALVWRSAGDGPFRDVAPLAVARLPRTRVLALRAALGCAVLVAQGFWIALICAR